jgi:hypothetical protein
VTVHVQKQTASSAETPAIIAVTRREAQFPKRTATACHSSHTLHEAIMLANVTVQCIYLPPPHPPVTPISPVTVNPNAPRGTRTYTSTPPYNTYAKPRPDTHRSSPTPRVAFSSLKSTLAVTIGDGQALGMNRMIAPPAGRPPPILYFMGFVLFEYWAHVDYVV